jgi:hypothetical protein
LASVFKAKWPLAKMDNAVVPVGPWLHHRKSSSSSLKGMGISIPPVTTKHVPRPLSQQDYSTKALPQLPSSPIQRLEAQVRNIKTMELELLNSQESAFPFLASYSLQSRKPPKGLKISIKSQWSDPATSTLTISSKKILQKTGYDPRFETSMPEQHQQPKISVTNSSLRSALKKSNSEGSSGSYYSQLESRGVYEIQTVRYSWDSLSPEEISPQISPFVPTCRWRPIPPLSSTMIGLPPIPPVQKPARCVSPHRSAPFECATLEKYSVTKRPLEIGHLVGNLERPSLQPQGNLSKASKLQEIQENEHAKHRGYSVNRASTQDQQQWSKSLADNGHLIPKPLQLRKKSKPEHINIKTESHLEEEPTMLQHTQNSFHWATKKLASPRQDGNSLHTCDHHPSRSNSYRSSTASVSVTSTMQSDFLTLPGMPPPPIPRKHIKRKTFGTGNYPLRNPFPKSTTHRMPDTCASPTEKKFQKRLSGAMKYLPGLSSPAVKGNLIPISERSSDGPDTLHLDRSYFPHLWSTRKSIHNGNEHLHDVITKVRHTMQHKSSDEKRRESLKKKILVVGITDQAPGKNVSLSPS